MSQFDLNILLF